MVIYYPLWLFKTHLILNYLITLLFKESALALVFLIKMYLQFKLCLENQQLLILN